MPRCRPRRRYCSAGGQYNDTPGRGQVFVVDEVNGAWAKAKEVLGTVALNRGGQAQVLSVSCAWRYLQSWRFVDRRLRPTASIRRQQGLTSGRPEVGTFFCLSKEAFKHHAIDDLR